MRGGDRIRRSEEADLTRHDSTDHFSPNESSVPSIQLVGRLDKVSVLSGESTLYQMTGADRTVANTFSPGRGVGIASL
jgi:hypothetical protein